jgi:hypothetical protein
MEKSSQMMIDTSSKKKKKSEINEAQQEADKLIQRIINDDEDLEDHVSAM